MKGFEVLTSSMFLSDFSYHLPEELIAHYPAKERSSSRLFCLDAKNDTYNHTFFHEILDLVRPSDLLIFNDTRVIPGRLFAFKRSGGRVEVLIERLVEDDAVVVQLRASKPVKVGSSLFFNRGGIESGDLIGAAEIIERNGQFYTLRFEPDATLAALIKSEGHIPLPPYIKRPAQELDEERYQTIYAKKEGAVAAPTAGLHFDQALLEALSAKGVDLGFLTLHVGAGTFMPVRATEIADHEMHHEFFDVSNEICEKVSTCKAKGGRVIAVGTTSVRSLEAASQTGVLMPTKGETNIFIYPGYEFKTVDAMITNFHLSESTLLMLVSAFAGRDRIMRAYSEAIVKKYRFFSYGDSMFLYRS